MSAFRGYSRYSTDVMHVRFRPKANIGRELNVTAGGSVNKTNSGGSCRSTIEAVLKRSWSRCHYSNCAVIGRGSPDPSFARCSIDRR